MEPLIWLRAGGKKPSEGAAMDTMLRFSSDVAFTPVVKAIQAGKGSRAALARHEEAGAWPTAITPDLAAFIAEQRSVFLATASAASQPYIQHRGGPPGFLHVLDDKTIAFVDFTGNRQYITQAISPRTRRPIFFSSIMRGRGVSSSGARRAFRTIQRSARG